MGRWGVVRGAARIQVVEGSEEKQKSCPAMRDYT